MRNQNLYLKRCERLHRKRKAKRLQLKKYGLGIRTGRQVVIPGNAGWWNNLIAQLIRRERGEHVDKDKERRHQDR